MNNKKMTTKKRGQYGELLAADYLTAHGLNIVAKNVYSRYGEIDLITQDDRVLVFVEVRLRRAQALVSAAESITPEKLRRCYQSAQDYLQKNYAVPPDCRFDAVLITQYQTHHEIEWLKNVIF